MRNFFSRSVLNNIEKFSEGFILEHLNDFKKVFKVEGKNFKEVIENDILLNSIFGKKEKIKGNEFLFINREKENLLKLIDFVNLKEGSNPEDPGLNNEIEAIIECFKNNKIDLELFLSPRSFSFNEWSFFKSEKDKINVFFFKEILNNIKK